MKNKIFKILLALMFVFIYSCKEEFPEDRVYITEDELQISAFVEETENLSMTSELLHRSGYFNLLNAYGSYTLFAPTNDAWNAYLSSIGKSGMNELSDAEVTALFDFHVLVRSVDVRALNTGLLNVIDTTMSGMRHFADVRQGITRVEMNKNVNILSTYRLPNGFVYITNGVFRPRPENLYDYLLTNGYSIFANAIEAVEMKDTLQSRFLYFQGSTVPYQPRWTLFATPDDVYRSKGINNVTDLFSSVWGNAEDGEYATPDEAVLEYIRYHMVYMWQGDQHFWINHRLTTSMFRLENIRTLAHGKGAVLNISPSSPIAPDPVINGHIKLNIAKSDVSFLNGVLHELTDVMYVDKTKQLLDFYFFEAGEIFAERQLFRVPQGQSQLGSWQVIYTDVDFSSQIGSLGVQTHSSFTSTFYDVLGVGIASVALPTDRGFWIEFYLRNVPAHPEYEVILNYRRRGGDAERVSAYMRKLGDPFEFGEDNILTYQGADNPESEAGRINFRRERVTRQVNGRDVDVFIPEFNQMRRLGTTKLTAEGGDFIIRFVHTDSNPGVYDNIILVPVFEEEEDDE